MGGWLGARLEHRTAWSQSMREKRQEAHRRDLVLRKYIQQTTGIRWSQRARQVASLVKSVALTHFRVACDFAAATIFSPFPCLYFCVDSSRVHSSPQPTFPERTSSGQHESMHLRLPNLRVGHLRPKPVYFLVDSVSRLWVLNTAIPAPGFTNTMP